MAATTQNDVPDKEMEITRRSRFIWTLERPNQKNVGITNGRIDLFLYVREHLEAIIEGEVDTFLLLRKFSMSQRVERENLTGTHNTEDLRINSSPTETIVLVRLA